MSMYPDQGQNQSGWSHQPQSADPYSQPSASGYSQPSEDPYAAQSGGYPQAGGYQQPGDYSTADPYAMGQYGYAPAPTPYGYSPYGAMAPQPGAPWGVDPRTGLPYSDKTKLTAGLLGILLGSFGVGRFYTGHIGIAIAQIAVTWLTLGVGAIWPLIDGIIMLTGDTKDSRGYPLRPGN